MPLKRQSLDCSRLLNRKRLQEFDSTSMTEIGTESVLKIVVGGVRYRAQRCRFRKYLQPRVYEQLNKHEYGTHYVGAV
jgi:hypothetical protein